MTPWKKQVSEGELYEIRAMLRVGMSIPAAAASLWRNKTTLYRILKVNGVRYGHRKLTWTWGRAGGRDAFRDDGKARPDPFLPRHVHLLRERRRAEASSRWSRITPWSELERFVLEKVRLAWSPEQIAGRWTFRTGEPLSKDTVYRFVRSARPEYVKKHFRRRGKRYVDRVWKRTAPHGKRRIGERPAEAESRTVIGHWEGDTVLGIRGGPSKRAILTNVERVSGYLLAGFLNGKNGECVAETTLELFQGVPESKRKTMTYDNGSEFAEYWYVEEFAGMDVFFANPYHSWKRGTNENTNGLLRQFVPKGVDLAGFRKADLAKAVSLLNNRPRKRLGYLTPHEVFVRGMCIPKMPIRSDMNSIPHRNRALTTPFPETLTIGY